MIEKLVPSQGLQELITLVNKDKPHNETKRAQLFQMPSLVDELAQRNWALKMRIEKSSSTDEVGAVLKDPIYKAAEIVVENHSEEVHMTVRDLLIEKYGFDELEISRFNRFNKDENKLLVRMFFVHLGYSTYSDSLQSRIGIEFTKKMKRLENRSILDLIHGKQHLYALDELRSRFIGQAS